MSGYEVCPHDRDTFFAEAGAHSYRCPECQARVCLTCRRHGWKDALIPLVSWMTGTCDDCYREGRRRDEIRAAYYRARDRRTHDQHIWDEGRTAAADATNPYADPDEYSDETWLPEQHEWLREEVQS